jgi:serine/threonine protein kinase
MSCLRDDELERMARGTGATEQRAHLDGCPQCRERLEAIRRNLALEAELRGLSPAGAGEAGDRGAQAAPTAEIVPDAIAGTRRSRPDAPPITSRAPAAESRGNVVSPQSPGGASPALFPASERYKVLGELGRGGMGVVYKAHDSKLNRVVALKVLIAGEGASEEEVKRFFQEATSAARLRHPNIVPIHELDVREGRHYFTMDCVEGGPLSRLISERALTPRRAVEIIEQVARAVHHAHEHGIIHRDIKPSNVIVTPDGTPMVMDFGLAKQVESDTRLTRSGVAMGTPEYMAPEQARGETGKADRRTDVWALGAVLYEMVTGLPPFVGATSLDIVSKVVHDDPVPPRKYSHACPRDMETICLKCLEKDPRRRYQTADALAEDARRFLAGEPISARPASLVYRARKRLARHKAVAAVTTVAAAALMALGLWSYFRILGERNEAIRQRDEARRQKLAAEEATRREIEALKRKQEEEKARVEAERRAKEMEERRRREAERVWQTVFEPDVSKGAFEPGPKGEAWLVSGWHEAEIRELPQEGSEAWKIEEGEIVGQGAVSLALPVKVGTDAMIEFEARALEGANDMHCFLKGRDRKTGYTFHFGGWNNQKSAIAKHHDSNTNITILAEVNRPAFVEPGKTYHIQAIAKGGHLEMRVNGEKLLEAEDKDPYAGPGRDRAGLDVGSARIAYRNVKIAELGPPIKATLQEAAEMLFGRSEFGGAAELLELAAERAAGQEREALRARRDEYLRQERRKPLLNAEELTLAGNGEEAKKLCEGVLASLPDPPVTEGDKRLAQEARYVLGLALGALGENEAAVEELRTATALMPATETARKAYEAIPKVGEHTFGPFVLLERLKLGFAGEAWKARWTATGEVVCLQILPPEYGDERTPEEMRLFGALTEVRHPAIPQLLSVGGEGGRAWAAWEYVRGARATDLAAARIGMQVSQWLRIVPDMARATGHLHEQGFVDVAFNHLNVIVRYDGVIKCLPSLRYIKIARPDGTVGVGPVASSAPETGSGVRDRRSDLFSLGVLAYAYLAGTYPPVFGIQDVPEAKGTLVVEDQQPSRLAVAKRLLIGIVGGKIVGVDHPDELPAKRVYLGQTLIDLGFATTQQVQDALSYQATLRRDAPEYEVLGQILIERGMCTSEQVAKGLAEQAKRAGGLVAWVDFRWGKGFVVGAARDGVVLTVNGEPVRTSLLRPGNKIRIGDAEMTFECPPGLDKLRWPPIDPPSKYNPDVPPLLDRAVLKLLEFDPDDRYQSAEEFLKDIESLRDRRKVALEKALGGRELTHDDLMSNEFLQKYMDEIGEKDALRALAWLPLAGFSDEETDKRSGIVRRAAARMRIADERRQALVLASRLERLGSADMAWITKPGHLTVEERAEADSIPTRSAAVLDRPFVRRSHSLGEEGFRTLLAALVGDSTARHLLTAASTYTAMTFERPYRETPPGERRALDAIANMPNQRVSSAVIDAILSEPLEDKLALIPGDDLKKALDVTEIEPVLADLASRMSKEAVDRWLGLLPADRAKELEGRLAADRKTEIETYIKMREGFLKQLEWAVTIAESGKKLKSPPPMLWPCMTGVGVTHDALTGAFHATHLVTGEPGTVESLYYGSKQDWKDSFREYAEIARGLRGKHLVLPTEVHLDAWPFLVFGAGPEHILEQAGDAKQLSAATVLRWIKATLNGLGELHAQGVVHRDVTPKSIWVYPDGAKLAGLGLAERMDAPRFTERGIVPGTPYYMSPEACRGDRVDGRSDLYNLGATVYHVIAGRPPFEAPDARTVLKMHQEDEPTPPRELNPRIPPELEAWILKLMAKSPDDRYQTAEEARKALEDVIRVVEAMDPPLMCPKLRGEARQMQSSGPDIRLVNTLILDALKSNARGIRLDPVGGGLSVRFRIGDAWLDREPISAEDAAAVVTRLKIMADLQLAETSRAQTGQINLNVRGEPYLLDLRTVPGEAGEGVIIEVK